MNSKTWLSTDLPADFTDGQAEAFLSAVETVAAAYGERTISTEQAGDRICRAVDTLLGEPEDRPALPPAAAVRASTRARPADAGPWPFLPVWAAGNS
jgi:hypothetical protein